MTLVALCFVYAWEGHVWGRDYREAGSLFLPKAPCLGTILYRELCSFALSACQATHRDIAPLGCHASATVCLKLLRMILHAGDLVMPAAAG